MKDALFPLPAIVRQAEEDLATLAAVANAEHEASCSNDRASLEHRRNAGDALLRAKTQCKRGQWDKWLKQNITYSRRTAYNYIAIATKCASVAHFSDLTADEIRELLDTKPGEEEDAEAASLPKFITLDEWQRCDPERKTVLLNPASSEDKFNNQGDNENIEWALWSWNPVTGCLHNCPYCYARDIAERFYEQKFVPALWPGRLKAPHNTSFPEEKAREWMGHKNVFVCSMADLFGRWVPTEWIQAVLREVRTASQWNFLFLTKFPIRMAEFDFPDNAWVGTTVDCQARVANAEKAFRKVRAGVKWLSCEPLIEPLHFKDIAAFDWIVLGGASPSRQTPQWNPPFSWVNQLLNDAVKAGVGAYVKTNCRIRQYPGVEEPTEAPEELRYLPEVQA